MAAAGPAPSGGSGVVDARDAPEREAQRSCAPAAGGGAATVLPEAQAGARSSAASTSGAGAPSAPAEQGSQRRGADEAGRGAGSGVPAGSPAKAALERRDIEAVDSRGGRREGADTGGMREGARGPDVLWRGWQGGADPPAAGPSLAHAPPERAAGRAAHDPPQVDGDGGGAFDDLLGVHGSGELGLLKAGSGHEDGAAADAGPPVSASRDAKAGAGARAAPEADAAQGAAEHEVAAASPSASPFLDVHARAGDAGHVSPDALGVAVRPAGPDAGHLSAQSSPREVSRFREIVT